ncbi:DUF6153 family protein [Streptomyces sp. NPDC059373]
MTGLDQFVRQPQQGPRPLPRPCVLLVLGLLVGLLGMHGLSPTAMPMPGHGMTATAGHATAILAHGDCGSAGHGCDGQAHHADATCASGAPAAGPALPALNPDPVCVGDEAETLLASVPDPAEGGRAPPSLAELQLLRI